MHRRAIILTIGLVTTVALTTFTPLSLARLRVNLPLHNAAGVAGSDAISQPYPPPEYLAYLPFIPRDEASPPSYSVYMPVILRNG